MAQSTFDLISSLTSGNSAENSTTSAAPEVVEETLDQEISQEATEEMYSGDQTEEGLENSELSADSEDSSSDEDSSHKVKEKTSKPEVEYLTVKDHNGRRVKVKVDYSDKDSIKRAYSMAAGMRKFQAERDNLRKEYEEFKTANEKPIQYWNKIQEVYDNNGIPGLVNFLEGKDNAFDELVDQTVKEREWRANASPEEIRLHQERLEQSKKNQELEALKRELEEIKNSQMSAKEEAELSSLKAEINPVFDKYRFAGKLNNPAHEHMLDEMLWNNALKQLESLPDDMEVSSATINKIFRDYSNNLRTLVNKQVDKKVQKAVAQKKRTATENAQVKASKSLANAKQGETAQDMLKQGRITDLFKSIASKNKNFIS